MKKNSGFTLIETIIVSVLVVLMMGALFNLLFTGNSIVEEVTQRGSLETKASFALDQLAKDISLALKAQQFSINNLRQLVVISGQNRVNLNAADDSMPWGADGLLNAHINYQVTGTDLVRQLVDSHGAVLKSSIVTSNLAANDPANFTVIQNSDLVTVTLKLSETIYRSAVTKEFTRVIRIRN